jgi:hypothetical protein
MKAEDVMFILTLLYGSETWNQCLVICSVARLSDRRKEARSSLQGNAYEVFKIIK